MGLDLKDERNKHLMPRVAMRKDEIKDDSALLCVKPDMEALQAWQERKNNSTLTSNIIIPLEESPKISVRKLNNLIDKS